jgi:hypothetical protein
VKCMSETRTATAYVSLMKSEANPKR